jgi:hypothetical protein
MRCYQFGLLYFTLAMVVPGALAVAEPQTQPERWEDVVRYWTERAKKVPTLRAKCSERTFLSAGVLRKMRSLGRGQKEQTAASQFTDVELTADVTFHADGLRWKMESRGPTWSSLLQKVVMSDAACAFDGEKWTAYEWLDAEPSPTTRPGWAETSASGCLHSREPKLIPWMLLLRPFEAGCSVISPDQWSPHGELTRVGEGNENRFRQELRSPRLRATSELLLDPQCDLTLRRYESGRIIVEIDQKEYPPHGWFPKHFRCTQLTSDKSAIESEIVVDVESMELDVPATEVNLELKFPPGTIVRDMTSGADIPRTYYVRKDASVRDITPAEWGATFQYDTLEDTLAGSSISTMISEPSTGRSILVIVNLAALSAILLAILIKRVRYTSRGGGS